MFKKIVDRFFGNSAAGLYTILFAAAIGIATFVENDFGTSAAQKIIFKSTWFEVLLLLFGLSILANIFRYRMAQNKRWALLTFHAAILVILIGAAVTRYFGYEGMMHIREDDSANSFISAETYLLFEAKQGDKTYRFDEKVFFASLGRNHFDRSYQIGKDVIHVSLDDFIPNPENVLEPNDNGVPVLKLVIAGDGGREEYYLQEKDFRNIKGTWFNFGNPEQANAINIYYRNDSLVFSTPQVLSQLQMMTQKRDTIYPGAYQTLLVRALYSNDLINFVIGDFNPKAVMMMKPGSRKMKSESLAALKLNVEINGESNTTFVYGQKGAEGKPQVVKGGNTSLSVAYGSKEISLPFSIRLRDFIMDRYPGTNSASSYASEVTLIDPRNNLKRDQRIYMNNILNYGGYRFFQSSFDQDELGTVLSVNHDFWGTWISYTGYFLLTVGFILSFFSPKSRFRELSQKLKAMRTSEAAMRTITVFVFLLGAVLFSRAETINGVDMHVIPKDHAAHFGRLIVQDHKGRMKPMNTMCSEVLRKISRRETFEGLDADQVFLGMTLYPEEWIRQPLIKIGSQEEIRKLLPGAGEYASFENFFGPGGQYLLKDQVRKAYSLPSIDRNQFDKDIMKIDERVNICNMVFNGSLARIYPVANHPDNLWLTPADVVNPESGIEPDPFAAQFFGDYAASVDEAMVSGRWNDADKGLDMLHQFQHDKGGNLLLSDRKINMEILLNKMNVFSRLSKTYGLLGFVFLVLFFTTVFRPQMSRKWPTQIAFYLMLICFAAHVTGLAIRWYVSGRAPWSNGYESMIYIGFTTVLAGLIFARKSLGGLTATAILASTILMVAGLSWLDPEITPLVPVLRSYWLTIHVSMEAGSYGFLMLGAIIGLLNLALMIFINNNNRERLNRTIQEMTWVSEMTLIGGLFMVSIGTYLGGVWANESWGRYWGWDAKETWALVTTLVYSFILHMRLIPGLRGVFAFNLASLFGFGSVMMTYFGVNYYLSGLHSYAAGDPVPIPPSVYYTASTFAAISLLALWRQKALDKPL